MTSKISQRLAPVTCIAAGVLISALPHFVFWARIGRPYYVASPDDRFYLAVASQAYANHPWRISDPVLVAPGPTMYRSLQFLPGIWGAKLLGLDPLAIGLVWRVFAGATIGLGWYVLFQRTLKLPWIAASLAIMLLGDPGLLHGVPLIRVCLDAVSIFLKSDERFFQGGHWIFHGWRSVTPAMTMVYLMGFVWSVLRARDAPTRRRIALAGLTFGLLFYVYFYYWTAAVLALLFAAALDAGYRRVYFHAGCLGGLIGLPVLVSDFFIKQRVPSMSDWLLRCDRFLPVGPFDKMELHKDMMVIPALCLLWVLFRQRDLIFVWALGAAGLLLEHHQFITRLQLENYHWTYVWGPAFSFLTALAVVKEIGDRLNWAAWICTTIGAVAVLAFGVGLSIRWVEATGTSTVATARAITAYRAEFPPGHQPRFAPNTIVAGDRDFVDFASILDNLRPLAGWCAYYSCAVTDAELDEREGLNGLLRGDDRATFEAAQTRIFSNIKVGPWYRDRSLIAVRVAARLSAYDRARENLPVSLERFAVRYVGVLSGTKLDYVAEGWSLIVSGPTWDVWEPPPSLAALNPPMP